MTIAPQDSPLLRDLFADAEVARLFSDTAAVRAMLIVEGTLAKVQGDAGMIPADAAAYLHRAAMEVQIDPAGLAPATAQNGVCVPALVAAFRKEAQAPEFTQYLHWGATSQDIIDTGLALRLRQVLTLIETRLDALLIALADLATAWAETPMVARTYGQPATVTTLGAQVASWGTGLLSVRDDLAPLREAVLMVTLNGAAGTLSAMGPEGPAIRAELAKALGLRNPGHSPHADRAHIQALSAWCNRLLQAAAKMAGDLLLLTRDGTVRLDAGGASSTMPQKANPVAPSVVRALAAHGAGHAAALSMIPAADARDGAAWFTEWLSLPPLLAATARSLTLLRETSDPDHTGITLGSPAAFPGGEDPSGLIHAEAVTFALAQTMPRPEAQAQVKAWTAQVRATGVSLLDLAGVDPDAFRPNRQWGEAPDLARRFAARVRGTE
ncbi:3-carboxy-cis,cis-muconate cycloisomerase [Jannaschia pagri]|uniref:3-carboxy-cis,cis-muconate cycloisomerase n=1 Tax=Jannaschia pagri TaxID=2829797 RepID=A0ABQ4NKM2_9RHOB|nr:MULTISPECIES: lyase family protein [unclassified Jannaschia]GIT90923.1 3-carboxy-cis,cis-muconate cycloisomerase [Jannaschia sp. AI_61]GIT94754.1 3-carboxy-cis,cis-muconate cycloisomerase [Jannaschia sp. AI_62]